MLLQLDIYYLFIIIFITIQQLFTNRLYVFLNPFRSTPALHSFIEDT